MDTTSLLMFLASWSFVNESFRDTLISVQSVRQPGETRIRSFCRNRQSRDGATLEVSISLDSDIESERDSERFSLGVSVVLEYQSGSWRVLGDTGWSCRESGWETDMSEVAETESVQDALLELEGVTRKLLSRYSALVGVPSVVSEGPAGTESGEEEA